MASGGPSGSMELFVTTVRSLSGAGNFHDLVEFLHKSGDSLVRNTPTVLDTVLETLDIQQHSLGVLAILSARLQQSNVVEWEDLYNRISVFILECNGEQIRYSAESFAELCHLFASQLIQKKSPILGIPALLKAIGKIQLNEKSLTSVHADVCKLCLASKCFAPARDILKVDYVDVAKEATLDPKHVLLFFYYGGMIATALKQFERSLYFYEACITLPAVAVSHILLESYKKFLLVSLIVNGDKSLESFAVLPKYTSPIVNKFIRPLCRPYHDLVSAYFTNQVSAVESVVNKYGEVFASDNNCGLVSQAAASQTKSNIKRLTKTFVTLSLEDVAARVGLKTPLEAERQIVQMIHDGSIHARISQKDGMVRFDTNPEKYNSVAMMTSLEANIKSCISLNRQVTQMEEEIVLNANYIKKSSVGAAGGSSGAPGTPGNVRSSDLDDDLGYAGLLSGGGSHKAGSGSSYGVSGSVRPVMFQGTSSNVSSNHVTGGPTAATSSSSPNTSSSNGPSAAPLQ